METNPSEDTNTEPKEFENFCIRQYVSEVRKKDWKKCCPFNLSARDSPESTYQAERLFASLILDDNEALVDAPNNTQAPNSLTSSEVGNPEVQAAISQTHTGAVSGNDATNTAVAENDQPEDAVVDDDESPKEINGESSKSSSSKQKDDVQYQNKNIISKDNEAVVDDKYTTSDEERNLPGGRPKKFRLLSDIIKELNGPCDAASAAAVYGTYNEFSSESEEDDDSDEFTLETSVKKKKGVRVASRIGVVSKKKKKKKKSHKLVRERSFDRAKRLKPTPEESSGKDTEVRLKRPVRKTRTDHKVDLQKHKKSSDEIIVHDSTSGTQKDPLISRGSKRSRRTIQDDSRREVLELLDEDRSPGPFTKENSSRSTHGVKSAELVQSTSTAILKNTETTSGYVEKSIRENSPQIDNESMAALQLLRLFKSGETTAHTSSETATEDPALSVPKGDGKMASGSGSIVGQSREELNMINGAGLPQDKQNESGELDCVMSMNPSEFSIPNAKKYMRRVKVTKK